MPKFRQVNSIINLVSGGPRPWNFDQVRAKTKYFAPPPTPLQHLNQWLQHFHHPQELEILRNSKAPRAFSFDTKWVPLKVNNWCKFGVDTTFEKLKFEHFSLLIPSLVGMKMIFKNYFFPSGGHLEEEKFSFFNFSKVVWDINTKFTPVVNLNPILPGGGPLWPPLPWIRLPLSHGQGYVNQTSWLCSFPYLPGPRKPVLVFVFQKIEKNWRRKFLGVLEH